MHYKNRRLLASFFCVLIFSMIQFPVTSSAQVTGERLLSPKEKVENGTPGGWQRNGWTDAADYAAMESTRSDHLMLVMQSDSLARDRFFKPILLTPASTYKLGYWIKTEEVEGENEKAGAGVRLGRLDFKPDTVWQGNNGWTYREITFQTKDDDSMVLEFLLGKKGAASGKVYVDEITLERVSHQPLDPSISVNLADTGPQMSEYIYGQFIEHMGRSIYGGIWAEMLEDRKFYFVPGTKRSPWKMARPDSVGLIVDSLDAYVGENTPILRATAQYKPELFQDSLALEKGKKYEGRIILAGTSRIGPAEVRLTNADNGEVIDKVSLHEIGRDYKKFDLRFSSDVDLKNGRISIQPRGTGVLQIGTLSLMPADNIHGFRPDVIALLEELDSPVYRWPGGNFVSGYNWKDGVGHRDRRPPRLDRAWLSQYEHPWDAVESNDVGIHEFMRLCKLLDAEPYVAVNTGLGTAKLAAEEVEYLNGDTTTTMGNWRAENGHPQSYDVRFFAVGNEMFGDWQLGHMPLDRYVKKHNRVARAMWDVDPDIDLVAVGASGRWDKQMYKHSADFMTYISEHFYRQNWHGGGLMTHVNQIPDAIENIADEHRKWRRKLDALDGKDIKIALDEWNYWYGDYVYGLLGTRYYLQDALGIAAGLNAFMRNSDIYYMANYAQTVNVIGAIKTTKTDAFMAATGVVLSAYREHFGYTPVAVSGEELPFDIAGAVSKDGKYLTLSVVNPTQEEHSLDLEFVNGEIAQNGTAYVITGDSRKTYNDVEHPNRVDVDQRGVGIKNGSISVTPMSANIYRFKIE